MTSQKYMVIGLLVCVAFNLIQTEAACTGQNMGINPANNHCYMASTLTMTFDQAREYCQSYATICENTVNAHIADFDNLEEEVFAESLLVSQPNAYFWIGLREDPNDETNFRWVTTSQPPNYTNWGPNEPDSGATEDECVRKNTDVNDYKWIDTNCANLYNVICEFEP